jgi:hypothetical protein
MSLEKRGTILDSYMIMRIGSTGLIDMQNWSDRSLLTDSGDPV